jgi:hypothetical protein
MPALHRRIRPYRTHGLYRTGPTQQQLTAGATLKDQLVNDLGGPDVVSTAESMLIDLIVAAKVKHADAVNYLVALPRPWCNRKSHAVWKVVLDTTRLEAHLCKLLQALGLDRRAQDVDLIDEIQRLHAEDAEDAAPDAAVATPEPPDSHEP